MAAPTEVTIQGTVFRITPFDPFTQLRLFGDLQKEILPAVGGVLNVALVKSDDAGADAAAISAFRDLSMRFDGATLQRWAELLIRPEHVSFELDGRAPQKLDKPALAVAFRDFSDVLELMYYIGKVNFAGPLARWAGLTGLAQKLTGLLPANSGTTS